MSPAKSCQQILRTLRSMRNPANVAGMARFGIQTDTAFGVSVPALRRMAKEIGTDHGLALELWESGQHEARLLATMIDDPAKVTGAQMEKWVRGFDSWDVCDLCCSNLFDKTKSAHRKAAEWAGRKSEFVKRAGFAMMAALSVHDKAATDGQFEAFLPLILREAGDERNFVKKAVNWALRQIGKRNLALNRKAIRCAEAVRETGSRSARWIASDALRELRGEAVQTRLRRK